MCSFFVADSVCFSGSTTRGVPISPITWTLLFATWDSRFTARRELFFDDYLDDMASFAEFFSPSGAISPQEGSLYRLVHCTPPFPVFSPHGDFLTGILLRCLACSRVVGSWTAYDREKPFGTWITT